MAKQNRRIFSVWIMTCMIIFTGLWSILKPDNYNLLLYSTCYQQTNTDPNSVISRYINVDIPNDPLDTFECFNYSISGHKHVVHPICIYDPAQDGFISKSLKQGKGWEVKYVTLILGHLGIPSCDVGFIDIGANIGALSLAVAAVGHQVVAVEPSDNNVRRLRKAISIGGFENQITVAQAGISNETGEMYLKVRYKNPGASFLVAKELCVSDKDFICDVNRRIPLVYMDDLVNVIPFNNAVMKIDIEGFEYKAFKKANKLLKKINVFLILMEFVQYIHWWDVPRQKQEIDKFISDMNEMGYTPGIDPVTSLENKPWNEWPDNIVWMKV